MRQPCDFTPEQWMALVNALLNLAEEMRVKWLGVTDVYELTNEDRQINNAWLSLGGKPFDNRAFEYGLPMLTGKHSLYPDPVDVEALRTALIKMNGGGQ